MSITRSDLGTPVTGASGLLCLAATPVFAAMAWATRGGDMPDMPGMDMPGMASSPLNGMALMYLLMAVFHAAPWLTLIASRRGAPRYIQLKESEA
ncbi:MAG: hypothetical protein V4559_01110 [Pseudomonadota bacterium]